MGTLAVTVGLVSALTAACHDEAPGAAARASGVNVDNHMWANWNPPRTGYVSKRLPDGQPDIQGIYMWPPDVSSGDEEAPPSPRPRSVTPDGNPDLGAGPEFWYERSYDANGKPVELSRPRYPTVNEPMLFQPWAAAKRDYIRKNENRERRILDPSARCLRRGLPRINELGAYISAQFVQTSGKVTIFYEWNHDYRVIPLDGRPHVATDIRLWNGDSRGRWEGNTLVVDVTNFNDKTWIGHTSSGAFHSDALHVVERYTPVDADQIYVEIQVDDPKVLMKPYRRGMTFTRVWQPGYEQLEYACHEGNRAVDIIMEGAENLRRPPGKRK